MRAFTLLLLASSMVSAAEKPHLVIIAAEDEYKTEVTLPAFAKKHLDTDFKVSIIFADPKNKAHLPDLDTLKTADALLLSVRRKPLLKDDLAAVKAYVASGKPIIALRTSSHAFALRKGEKLADGVADWPTFDADVLGCHYTGHTNQKLGAAITVTAKDHAILKGVPAAGFHSQSGLYLSSPLAKDCVVLLTGKGDKNEEPVAWVREKTADRGRVAYLALAHETDFAGEVFPTLLGNTIRWAAQP